MCIYITYIGSDGKDSNEIKFNCLLLTVNADQEKREHQQKPQSPFLRKNYTESQNAAQNRSEIADAV